jgi:hypothetical protein
MKETTSNEGHPESPKNKVILIKEADGKVVGRINLDSNDNYSVEAEGTLPKSELEEKMKRITEKPISLITGYEIGYGEKPLERIFEKGTPGYPEALVAALNVHLWERSARLTGRVRWATLKDVE